ncbi:MAG: 50S ribosome-binding GTPase [Candidatus Heimdallarchaeota archaeon]|nr:50S ribosome-binding GTPase [Candidatus Heimdallarchaeota archaeon]MCK4290776.1 50S ribosome-binding GTPase [Candidatus Heimdallarchaeota archaeon]
MQKILLIGLDGVGKTSLYQKFFLKKDPVQLQKIQPTRGIAKYTHDFLRTDYTIIDAGGGKEFRQGYIGNTELVNDLSAIVFVVDVQNPPKYQETVNFFSVWLKSIANSIKGVKGYLLYNKVDPGKEGQVKQGLAHIAQLFKPIESMFPGEMVKTLTSIYSDSTNQIFQRMLLDLMPKRMSVPVEPRRIESTPTTPITSAVTPPIVKESRITQPTRAVENTTKISPPITPQPVKEKIAAPPVTPPKLAEPIKTSETAITPPAIDISTTMEKAEIDRIREKTAERLTDIIDATLNNNPGFEAIAVYSENVELIVGAVQQGGNPQILNSIELTLRKINLEEYMSRLGKVKVGGEGHIKIDTFDIFFEKVSPEHMSTVICSAIEEDTIKNIQQLNRYLNQALSISSADAEEDTFKRSDLMTELKLRLHRRGKSVDHVG